MVALNLRVLDTRVALRDGVLLATDVVVLDDGEQHPVLLVRTPYTRASLREGYDSVALARQGWAVVLQDVRGRGDSEGDFRPFAQEVADGIDTVAWCASQPWSDGRVAMMGASYNGSTQWLASGAPALRAFAPAVIGADFRDRFAYEGGMFQQGFLSGWAVAVGGTSGDAGVAAQAEALMAAWPEVLRTDAAVEAVSAVLPEYATWHADDKDWWASVAIEAPDLPAWHLAGWYDLFCEGSLDAYTAMVARGSSPQRLVIGPWAHVGLLQQVAGSVDFGAAAVGPHLIGEMTDFLRAALDGRPLVSGAAVFVMGANEWRELPSWPPACSPYVVSLDALSGGTAEWQHDAAAPVPTVGGRTLITIPAGPVDQREVQARDDVLVLTGEVLDADVTVMGTVTASLLMTSSASQADVCLTLCDVHPDGRVLNVVEGVQRTWGTPGEPRTVEVTVGSTAMRFAAGHRISVAVSAASWPRLDVSPSAVMSLDLAASTLTLPLVLEGT